MAAATPTSCVLDSVLDLETFERIHEYMLIALDPLPGRAWTIYDIIMIVRRSNDGDRWLRNPESLLNLAKHTASKTNDHCHTMMTVLSFVPDQFVCDIKWLADLDGIVSFAGFDLNLKEFNRIPEEIRRVIAANPDYLASVRCPIKPAKELYLKKQ